MENRKNYSIKEISRLLNIPKATIRYWDSQGLVDPERNEENDYREYSLALAMELGNISFYRSIDIPVKELKQMVRSDLGLQEEILMEASQRLVQKEAELKRQKERILMQMQALAEVRRLGETDTAGFDEAPGGEPKGPRMGEKGWKPSFAFPVFDKAVAFSHMRKEHWQKIIDRPWDFVLVFDGPSREFRYGIGYAPGAAVADEEEVIWKACGSRYVEDLLIADNRDESRNNLDAKRKRYLEQGIETGGVIAQFLTSGIRGREDLWDYYRMWMEVKQPHFQG